MKKFDIPLFYRSEIISKIKNSRKDKDPRKKDYTPTILDFGPVRFLIARHFGFCYGVENAIEIAYKTVEANPGKRIFLLSEMIHNPGVNSDLLSRGVRFIMDTAGNQIIPWSELNPSDIVIIPAFGTTLEIQSRLNEIGIDPYGYNTTCPFVEKVWNRSNQLGSKHYTVIIHGKHFHEETRATFSHAEQKAPSVIIKDLEEAALLASVIKGERGPDEFYTLFAGRYSEGFNPDIHLKAVGVVNQTTMLASETQAIADLIKQAMIDKYGTESLKLHFADTRDTLCYATNDNQEATYGLLREKADLAIIVGGYNSSNTSHIVELCEEKLPSYFISNADKIISQYEIKHYDLHSKTERITSGYLPDNRPLDIVLTSGASCPDAVVEEVLLKILSYFPDTNPVEEVIHKALTI